MATGGPGKPVGPSQHGFELDGDTGWVGVETDEETQLRDKNFPDDLKKVFGYRTVSSIPPEDVSKQLPEHEGPFPKQQEKKSKALARGFSRLLGAVQKSQVIFPHSVKAPPTEFNPLPPKTTFEETPVVYVSDDELIASMKLSGQVFIRPDSRTIFSGEPSPVDVQQTDKRSTCYMMSMLAGYAASPTGKKLLEAMVRPAGENRAIVTLYDPLVQDNIQVMVSTSRLVDKSGKDLYSFGNPTEARWAGIIEKAYHAYKFSRLKEVKAEIEKAKSAGELDRASYYYEQLHKVVSPDPKRSLIDWGEVIQSVGCIPELPEMENRPAAKYKYQSETPKKLFRFSLKGEEALKELRYNIELGVPMTLATRGKTAKGVLNTAKSGTMPDHAIAVLGPAEMMTHGVPVQGILVYDQHGAYLDGGAEINAETAIVSTKQAHKKTVDTIPAELLQSDQISTEVSDTTDVKHSPPPEAAEMITGEHISTVVTKAAGRSVRFYGYDELNKYFVMGALARGNYNSPK